jgi:hypothetical protein
LLRSKYGEIISSSLRPFSTSRLQRVFESVENIKLDAHIAKGDEDIFIVSKIGPMVIPMYLFIR